MPDSATSPIGSARARERAAARAAARAEAANDRAERGKNPEPKVAWDKERTRELFERYKRDGDEDARNQLIVNHLNLVRFLAGKFKNRGESMDDLIQVGTLGLIKAIDRFEPERGLEFTTFATPTILGEIRRHFRDKGWSVRVPRRLQELSAKVTQAADALTSELRRSPSVDEIAERLGVTPDEVLEAMESSGAYSAVPLEAPTGSGEDAPSVLDTYATEDGEFSLLEDKMVLTQALKACDAREREIIRMRFVEGLTQAQIAERLGVSQVQVSRLLRRILSKVQALIEA